MQRFELRQRRETEAEPDCLHIAGDAFHTSLSNRPLADPEGRIASWKTFNPSAPTSV